MFKEDGLILPNSREYHENSEGGGSSFEPISQLQRPDADISLFFLSTNGVLFSNPVDDPWYAVHRPIQGAKFGNNSIATYIGDYPVSVLGCTRQVQFCNPNQPETAQRCTPLSSADVNENNLKKLWSEDDEQQQIAVYASRVMKAQIYADVIPKFLGVSALTARYKMYEGVQAPLPRNQWQLDVEYWMDVALASLQSTYVESASGPDDPALLADLTKPDPLAKLWFCDSQVSITSDCDLPLLTMERTSIDICISYF